MNLVSTGLPRTPDSIGDARRLVEAHTTSLGPQRREDAALLVTELVTNALVHGKGAIGLRIDIVSRGLRVEVSDEGEVALPPVPTLGGYGGWGLRLVEQLADDWGVLEGSTKVWFRLDQPRETG
jgi:anti-sigma regulatory factor (Ser/Thr protein kinase)